MRYVILCLIFMCLSCATKSQLDIQGHRGFRGLYPENSLLAFDKALDLDIQTLELDVVISKDHKVVVSHEPFMNHEIALDVFGNEITTFNEKSFNLYTMPYDSIKLYDCGKRAHPRFPLQKKEKVSKPLLFEVITLAEKKSNKTIFYNIEIKSAPEYDAIYTPELDKYVSLVIDLIVSEGIEKRTILQSFDVRALEEIKRQKPTLKIALLVDENESIENKLLRLSFTPQIISPHFKLLDLNYTKKLQNDGFQIIPWTVNEPDDINLMLSCKVDGIISDFPNRVIQIKNSKQ